jgi:hypothetical protein
VLTHLVGFCPCELLLTWIGFSGVRFELWERSSGDEKEFSLRINLSEGAHSAPLDASLDAKHALQVQPRRSVSCCLFFCLSFVAASSSDATLGCIAYSPTTYRYPRRSMFCLATDLGTSRGARRPSRGCCPSRATSSTSVSSFPLLLMFLVTVIIIIINLVSSLFLSRGPPISSGKTDPAEEVRDFLPLRPHSEASSISGAAESD